MAYLETPQGFAPWAGEAISGVVYPRAIASLWPEADLNAIGLYNPAPADPVPDGKVSTGQTVKRVGGAVKFVHDLADAPEPEPQPLPTLKPYQFWGVLRATGHEVPLRAWVDSLNDPEAEAYDPLAWAHASAMLEFSQEYRRDHPLVEAARLALGLQASELDDLWAYAAAL
ncbi:hypothetical protein [Devosia sp. 63-57]|uniref:hypothetical protein n=1 Tax=Devosia sp. 63-57 TaxID=1895751 RepID=UPI00086BD411|nr:hypothetical protein [Devosia sp. 63-57]ODT50252.1 MAG: hypothetical protein ABS74_04870 [Pelagibacterium sp. SCN 63-126]ODU83023.1 MAG: hypothetical protein ABT14_16195 [Pelagibacterium sp. SCN 63-17]OJX44996.1 MAG: hypothetical protein BGO80_03870 [Devosia sp. 63-57]